MWATYVLFIATFKKQKETDEINFNIFYLSEYIQNIVISTFTQ